MRASFSRVSLAAITRSVSDLVQRCQKSSNLTLNSILTLRAVTTMKFHQRVTWNSIKLVSFVIGASTNQSSTPPLSWAGLCRYASKALGNPPPTLNNPIQFIKRGKCNWEVSNPWGDQLRSSFQLSIMSIVDMKTRHPDWWVRWVLSGTVSSSGLFRTVSRQDKACTCKLASVRSETWRRRCRPRSQTPPTFAA